MSSYTDSFAPQKPQISVLWERLAQIAKGCERRSSADKIMGSPVFMTDLQGNVIKKDGMNILNLKTSELHQLNKCQFGR